MAKRDKRAAAATSGPSNSLSDALWEPTIEQGVLLATAAVLMHRLIAEPSPTRSMEETVSVALNHAAELIKSVKAAAG